MQALPDVIFQGNIIKRSNLSYSINKEEIKFDNSDITGLAKLWTKKIEITDSPTNRNFQTDLIATFRNQNDNISVLEIKGDFKILSTERKELVDYMLCIIEYSFHIAKEYTAQNDIKGINEEDFVLPPNVYTRDYVQKKIDEEYFILNH